MLAVGSGSPASSVAPVPTVAVLQEDGDGERADLALHACSKLRVHRADDAQRLHHQVQDLGAELRGQVDQAVQDAGEEGLQDVGALRGFQLVTVTGETEKQDLFTVGPPMAGFPINNTLRHFICVAYETTSS